MVSGRSPSGQALAASPSSPSVSPVPASILNAPDLLPETIAFLRSWNEWRLAGAPDGEPFERQYGLCSNSPDEAYDNLATVFGVAYPFGEDDYDERQEAEEQHLCPKRIAWVEEQLAKAGPV